jgi:hypothetical protein
MVLPEEYLSGRGDALSPTPSIVIRSSVTRADQMVTDEESDLDEPQVTLTEVVIGPITEFRDYENFLWPHHLLENTLGKFSDCSPGPQPHVPRLFKAP